MTEKAVLQDVPTLLQDTEEGNQAHESLRPDVEELLQVLQFGDLYLARQDAAEQLGSIETSSPRIVQALLYSSESDPHPEVRRAAAESLRSPVHQEYLQRDPYLAIRTKAAEATSFLPAGSLRYWLLGTIYAPFLVGATYVAFAIEGKWVLWAVGAVWLIGGCFGLYVLNQKGQRAVLEKLLAKLEGPELGGLFLLAAVGPFLLLAALLMRTREPGYDAEAKPADQLQRPGLADATEKALQKILSSDTGSERRNLEAPLTDLQSGEGLSGLHSALLSLFVALSASVFLFTIDQLSIVRLDYLGVTLLNLLIGPALVGAVTGACYSYCVAGETTSSAGTIRTALGAAAGVVHAVVNLIRGRIMFSLPGYGWTNGELEYFFAISLGGNALFGAIAGLIGGAFVAFARGQSTARRTTRVGRWPLIGGLLLIAISVCIWVVIIATTTR